MSGFRCRSHGFWTDWRSQACLRCTVTSTPAGGASERRAVRAFMRQDRRVPNDPVVSRLIDHLLGWDRAVGRTYSRLLAFPTRLDEIEEHKRQADCRVLAVAVGDSLRVSKAIGDRLTGEPMRAARAAMSEFERRIPDLRDLRDILEHVDDYEKSKGDLQVAAKKGGQPLSATDLTVRFIHGGSPEIRIEGASSGLVSVSLLDAATESMTLASHTYGPPTGISRLRDALQRRKRADPHRGRSVRFALLLVGSLLAAGDVAPPVVACLVGVAGDHERS